MARLYPPSISGTLPSFYGNELKIPYVMNKIVSGIQVAGFTLRVKSASTETLLFQVAALVKEVSGVENRLGVRVVSAVWDDQSVIFELPGDLLKKLKISEHYKVQLAYIDVDYDIGYFSTVSIIKYTGKPQVWIANFDEDSANESSAVIVGTYSNESDYSEKDHEYRFILYANDKTTVLDDTGWTAHVAAGDVEAQSSGTLTLEQTDQYIVRYILDNMQTYYIRYMVRTNNDLLAYSPYYEIIESSSMDSTLQANLIAELDYDNACIVLKLIPYLDIEDTIIVGSFEIGRSSSLEDFKIWTIIDAFSINGHLLKDGRIFTDFTIEQGQTYKYAIRQKNANNVYSSWIPITKWRQRKQGYLTLDEDDLDWTYNSYVKASFEDAFLYDGKRQLKIRFNPKVSSFKTVLSDTKKTAIGSQYPYFFRNGIVSYKEFQISGLISYLSDEDQFFASRLAELGMDNTWQDTTDITDDNLIYERRFKMLVLDWLNEDTIKLFKSPGEGNYLVRLSNISLTPNDSLSRMIHTFNCTATEICEFTTDNLIKEDFLMSTELDEEQTLFLTTLLDGTEDNTPTSETDLFQGLYGNYVKFEDFMPGTQFKIGGRTFSIGQTGQYEAKFDEPVRGLILLQDSIDMNMKYGYRPSVTVGVKSKGFTSFDLVTAVQGRKRTFIRAVGDNESNILEPYYDLKHQIERLYYVKLSPRPLVDMDISVDALQAYVNKANERANRLIDIDIDCVYKFPTTEATLNFLYSLRRSGLSRYNNVKYNKNDYKGFVYISIVSSGNKYYYQIDDYYSTSIVYGKEIKYTRNQLGLIDIEYEDNIIDVSHTTMLTLDNLTYIPTDEEHNPYIVLGNGVVADFGIYQKIITYDMENDQLKISAANKTNFLKYQRLYNTAVKNWEGTASNKYKDSAMYRRYIATTNTISETTYNNYLASYKNYRRQFMTILAAELKYREDKAVHEG